MAMAEISLRGLGRARRHHGLYRPALARIYTRPVLTLNKNRHGSSARRVRRAGVVSAG